MEDQPIKIHAVDVQDFGTGTISTPWVPPLDGDERERRNPSYLCLLDLLVYVTGKDADYWAVYTYGELIAAALEALTAEQARIRPASTATGE